MAEGIRVTDVEPATLTKLEGARRQLCAAIRMLFHQEDSIAVHTLVIAAWRVLIDLHRHKGDPTSVLAQLESLIKPDMRKQVWSALWKTATFLKHAENQLSMFPST